MAVLVATTTLSCTSSGKDAEAAPDFEWTERSLPPHPGPPGRAVLRDVVYCAGAWWVAGAVFLDGATETRDTRPAVWSSVDGTSWDSVPLETNTYWGRRAIINSAACSRDRVALVGARSGGAHGNPRVTTFRQRPDGSFVDVVAVFTHYGGVTATNVGPIAGGPRGWLIAGNRLSGPGVWVTDDPQAFTKVEDEPGLVGGDDFEAIAQAPVWDGDGWTLVGGGADPSDMLDRDPAVWTSEDGLSWRRQAIEGSSAAEDMQRAVRLNDGRLLALGLANDRFAAWIRQDDTWESPTKFARVADTWNGTPYIASAAAWESGALVTLSTAENYELWHTQNGEAWNRIAVAPSAAPATASDHAMVVATHDQEVALIADDDQAFVWFGTLS